MEESLAVIVPNHVPNLIDRNDQNINKSNLGNLRGVNFKFVCNVFDCQTLQQLLLIIIIIACVHTIY